MHITSLPSRTIKDQSESFGHSIIAALTLVRYPMRAVPSALIHMGLDRLILHRAKGLRFWRLLGSSRGLAAGAWEPQRYGLFTVWDEAAALDAFEANSSIIHRYQRMGEEMWTVRLAPIRWHGAWGGDPFAGVTSGPSQADHSPLAILTRATIRPRYIRTFLRAAAPLTAELTHQPGLIASIGLGEVPLIFQATFSLWHDLPSAQRFAYSQALHTDVIKRTRTEGWYSEELFVRFRILASCGTWNGINPLAGI